MFAIPWHQMDITATKFSDAFLSRSIIGMHLFVVVFSMFDDFKSY
jgi:hypothetical protein